MLLRELSAYISKSGLPAVLTGITAQAVSARDRMVLLELAEIVLFAVVECANRERYIQAITGLSESAQKTIMDIIQRRIGGANDEEHSFDTQENSSPVPKVARPHA